MLNKLRLTLGPVVLDATVANERWAREVTLYNRPLRSVHVIAGLDPIYGGPSYTVPRLCQALTTSGAEARLLSVAGMNGGNISPNESEGRCFSRDWSRVPILRDLRCSAGLSRALRELAPKVDVIHDHGLWLMPNVDAGRAALIAGKPFIVAPRGMLAPAALAFSRLKKRIVWAFLQGEVLRRAACIHATSEQEHDEIREFGLNNPIAIIPNGIDLPTVRSISNSTNGRVVLSLGRIHPKKGLDRLVRAWATIEAAYPAWRLRIVGPDELGYSGKLAALAVELNARSISFEKSLAGDAKIAAYQEADLFVLPTLNENFAVTVAEALAAGTPVIATKGAPWRALESEGCGWWIDHGIEPLAAALANAMTMAPEKLQAMGAKGRSWVSRDFSWDRVACDVLDIYRWLALCGELPSTVRLK
jgi:glycosyltransferase involved in cell wall biosynthesis